MDKTELQNLLKTISKLEERIDALEKGNFPNGGKLNANAVANLEGRVKQIIADALATPSRF